MEVALLIVCCESQGQSDDDHPCRFIYYDGRWPSICTIV